MNLRWLRCPISKAASLVLLLTIVGLAPAMAGWGAGARAGEEPGAGRAAKGLPPISLRPRVNTKYRATFNW